MIEIQKDFEVQGTTYLVKFGGLYNEDDFVVCYDKNYPERDIQFYASYIKNN